MRHYDWLFLLVVLGIFAGKFMRDRAESMMEFMAAAVSSMWFWVCFDVMAVYYVITAARPAYQTAPMNPALHIIWLVIIGLMLVGAVRRFTGFRLVPKWLSF